MSYKSCRKRTQSTISADGQVVQFRIPVTNWEFRPLGVALAVVPTFAGRHRAHSPQLPRGHNWFSVVYITHPPHLSVEHVPLARKMMRFRCPRHPLLPMAIAWAYIWGISQLEPGPHWKCGSCYARSGPRFTWLYLLWTLQWALL